LWPNLTGGETLDLLSRLHGGFDLHRLDELVGWFELDTSRKARSYSKGNRQKVVLIAALASEAELLLLDEPTSGLDPLMEEVFRRCLEVERTRGRTVLLSSHLLAEVERLCGYVTIIRNGRAVESGSLDQLRHLSSTTVTAEISGTSDDLVKIDGVHDLVIIDGTLTCRVDDEHYGELLHRLSSLGVRRLEAHPPTLEEIFLRFYSDQEMPRP
jgi:ABC-2 type transport system ATP-binding protein